MKINLSDDQPAPERIPFITDDQIADQLTNLERSLILLANGISVLQTTIPMLARDAQAIADKMTALKRELQPAGRPTATRTAPAP